jgi:hypothetical protein
MSTTEKPFICQDGTKFWQIERCAMTQSQHIIDRMAGDIVTLAGEAGEWGEVTDREMIALTWSKWHVETYGALARTEAARRLKAGVVPLRELALACGLFAVITGGIWLTGAASLIERVA